MWLCVRNAAVVAALWLAALLATPATAAAAADATLPPPQVIALVDAGRFAEAEAFIARQLAMRTLSTDGIRALEFERERMRRIRLDFPLDTAAMLAQLRSDVPNLSDAEVRAWDRPTLLESLVIDGEKRYFMRAVPNLFRVSADARARRRPDAARGSDGPMENLNAHHVEVLASAKGDDHVASRRVRVTQSLIVNADAVPDGKTVRAWIPFPRAIDGQQDHITLLASEPADHRLAPESTLQRTVYLEQPARAGVATEFSISYELTVHGRHHPIVPETVVPAVASPELAPFLAEQPPHIVFTPALRAHSRQVVGEETNPYRIAQKLFAAVDTIPWGSAREYSTISNISDYALHQGHADCGQQTLLLITLLRLNGIPARWQSGMVFSDGDYDNLHDWGAMYLAPVGWVPMDVTTGQLDSDDPALRWFYFGSLDAYRIAFNDDISTPFDPPKQHFRSETVDSQRGEAEWDGGNLYYDQWDYRFEAQVLGPADLAK
jgi:transglutaminase-like putative cysteine protease